MDLNAIRSEVMSIEADDVVTMVVAKVWLSLERTCIVICCFELHCSCCFELKEAGTDYYLRKRIIWACVKSTQVWWAKRVELPSVLCPARSYFLSKEYTYTIYCQDSLGFLHWGTFVVTQADQCRWHSGFQWSSSMIFSSFMSHSPSDNLYIHTYLKKSKDRGPQREWWKGRKRERKIDRQIDRERERERELATTLY